MRLQTSWWRCTTRDSYLRYRMETVNEKGNQVRDVIESKDGTVARLILKDGKPLTRGTGQGGTAAFE